MLEQEKQVTNWMNSGGHVPHSYAENNTPETIGRHRAGRWKNLLIVGGMLLMLPLAADPGAARDPDGRYANSPLKQWFVGREFRRRINKALQAAGVQLW